MRRPLTAIATRIRSEAELAELAATLADSLGPGDVVHLVGELGAGKTTFVKHAAAQLGVSDEVTSPTFTVAHLYLGGRLPVSHLDLYRSGPLTVEAAADLDAYLDEDGVAFIEWPEAGAGVLPAPTHVVTLEHVEGREDERDVTLA